MKSKMAMLELWLMGANTARKGAKKVQDEVVIEEDPADEEAVKSEVKAEVKAEDDDV